MLIMKQECLLHVGVSPDHASLSWHILLSSPINIYPTLQVYVAVIPSSETVTLPFDGGDGALHSVK